MSNNKSHLTDILQPQNYEPYDLDAKTLYFDVEKSPTKGWAYESYETSLMSIEEDWHFQSISWAWGLHGKIECLILPDFKLYEKEPHNDRELAEQLHKLFKQADIIVGHNIRKFDMKMAKHRFIIHGLSPLPKLTIRDTLTMAKKYGFISNSLDNVSRELGIGRKLDTGVKELWKKCYNGDEKAWKLFKKYNKHDVKLTRAVDKVLLSWEDSIPSAKPADMRCPLCSSTSNKWKRNGIKYYRRYQRQRYSCLQCGFANIYGPAVKIDD